MSTAKPQGTKTNGSHRPNPVKIPIPPHSRYNWNHVTTSISLPIAPFSLALPCVELVANIISSIMQQDHGPDMPVPTILVIATDLGMAKQVDALLSNSVGATPQSWHVHGPAKLRSLAEQWLCSDPSNPSTAGIDTLRQQRGTPTCYLGQVGDILSCMYGSPDVMRRCTYVVILESPGRVIRGPDRQRLQLTQTCYEWLWVHTGSSTDTVRVAVDGASYWTGAAKLQPGPSPRKIKPFMKYKKGNPWRRYPGRDQMK